MLKVVFIAVRKHTNNTWLDEKVLQLTGFGQHWLSDKKHPVVVVDSYDDISNYMDADLLVVQTAGDMVFERDHLWNKILAMPEDIGLMGHLIWYPEEDGPYLHPQCFIIRPKAFANSIIDFSNGQDRGKEFTRSLEDMHGNHAPLWISYGNNIVDRKLEFGTKLLTTVLDNGYRLRNFDKDWRFPSVSNCDALMSDEVKKWVEYFDFPCIGTRGYCYPEENTEEFALAIKTLDPSRDINELQKLFIEVFRCITRVQHTNIVNIFHCDAPSNSLTAKIIISAANGLHGEIEAFNKGAKKIVFYDINKNNLDFKKDLYSIWDGKNYRKFAENWASSRNLITEPRWETSITRSMIFSEQYEMISSNWDYVKSIKKEFLHIDLISDYQMIIDRIEENTVLHTSTILNYYPVSNIVHSSQEISNVRNAFEQKINLTNSVWFES
jgi:hypothetical protein